jgi:uncharacterized protein YuzE
MVELRVTYDGSEDAAYIYLREIEDSGAKQTLGLMSLDEALEPFTAHNLLLDFDEEQHLIGIEVLNASETLPRELLAAAERIG